MTPQSVTMRALKKAFILALLLTGSIEESEAAVLKGIGRLDFDDDPSSETLILEALRAAISREREMMEQRPEEPESALWFLPREMRRVLRLPMALRHCFALRFLAGLPEKVCAPLLNLEIAEVGKLTGAAAQMLARISEEEEQANPARVCG